MNDTAIIAKPKPKGKTLAAWQDFEGELKQREASIVAMLPNHVSRDRFISSAVAAVKQTPELLTCTPRSLFSAITKSAQDGLLPDGREGVITIYKEKQKDGSWALVAQWNPMAWGLRRRAREIDDIIVGTNVVYENDAFLYEEGDEPKIEHKPAMLGQPRGAMIGAYAIFRNEGGILHREVMDADQIAKVRSQSKMPDGLMWTKFTTEAWRKTVLRRGFKSVPCSEKLETIVRRDDDLFNFDGDTPAGTAKPKATVIQPPSNGARKALPPVVGQEPDNDQKKPAALDDPDKFLADLGDKMEAADDLDALGEVWTVNVEPHLGSLFPPDADKARALYDQHKARIEG